MPEEVESYECVNILNYFGFPVNVEEDNICKGTSKYEMGFAKEDAYPCLLIDSSHEKIPSTEAASTHQILSFLYSKGFISDHKSHSAKESQTLHDFIESEVVLLMQEVLRPLRTKL